MIPIDSPDVRRCACGYDLAGLPGPPWVCPECDETWKPTPAWKAELEGEPFTDGERTLTRLGAVVLLTGMLAAALIAASTGSVIFGLSVPACGAAMIAWAFTTRWTRADQFDPETVAPRAAVYFVMAWIGAIFVGFTVLTIVVIAGWVFISIILGGALQ